MGIVKGMEMEMETTMLDEFRAKAYSALRSRTGNQFLPVRVTRGLLTFVNDMMGRPLAPPDEIAERRTYETTRRQKLDEVTTAKAAEVAKAKAGAAAAQRREAAPVVVYVDDKSMRDMKRIKSVFQGREIPFTELSVEHDESTRSWVQTTAKIQEMPVVFVAGQPVGGYDALVQLDANGELTKLVFGS
jgi:glutaredoxin